MNQLLSAKRQKHSLQIRKSTIEQHMRHRRRTLLLQPCNSPTALSPYHHLLTTSSIPNLHSYIQQLCDVLHKDIQEQDLQLLPEFMTFGLNLASTNDQKLISYGVEIVAMVAYEMQRVQDCGSVVAMMRAVGITENREIRQKCLLALTNLSSGSDPSIALELYRLNILQDLMEMLEDYPLTNQQKKDISGIYLNLTFEPDPILLSYSHILYNLVQEVSDRELIEEVVKCFGAVLRVFKERALQTQDYVLALQPLIRSTSLVDMPKPTTPLKFLSQLTSLSHVATNTLILNCDIPLLLHPCLLSNSTKLRCCSLSILYNLLDPSTATLFLNYDYTSLITLTLKCFFDGLRLEALRVLEQAATEEFMAEGMLQDEEFRGVIEGWWEAAEGDAEEGYVTMGMLESVLERVRDLPKWFIGQAKRIADIGFMSHNEDISRRANRILNKIYGNE